MLTVVALIFAAVDSVAIVVGLMLTEPPLTVVAVPNTSGPPVILTEPAVAVAAVNEREPPLCKFTG